MQDNSKLEMITELYSTIIKLQSVYDCQQLFSDLCTNKEIEQMAQRISAAKSLLKNESYTQIIKNTEISSATLSRVSRCIQYGSGGYAKFLEIKK